MSVVGIARPAPPFLLGFDCYAPVTDAMLQEATARGFKWVGRYLDNLAGDELARIHSYGFGVLPYLVAMTKEPLSVANGRARGRQACARAADLGMPAAVHVGADLESPMAGSDIPGHVNALAGELLAGHLASALYVGVPQPCSSKVLFGLRPNRYIKGGGRIADAAGELAEPACGWAALQLEPLEAVTLAGSKVDVEVTKFDYMGRALVLWWPS